MNSNKKNDCTTSLDVITITTFSFSNFPFSMKRSWTSIRPNLVVPKFLRGRVRCSCRWERCGPSASSASAAMTVRRGEGTLGVRSRLANHEMGQPGTLWCRRAPTVRPSATGTDSPLYKYPLGLLFSSHSPAAAQYLNARSRLISLSRRLHTYLFYSPNRNVTLQFMRFCCWTTARGELLAKNSPSPSSNLI